MSHFSFRNGEPIALIYGGEHNGKILRIDQNQEFNYEDGVDFERELDICADLIYSDKKNRRQISDYEQTLLEDCIISRVPPTDKYLKSIYNQCIRRLTDNDSTDFDINSGTLQPIPYQNYDDERTDRIYIAAPSGAGKSTFIALFLMEYKKMFPDNRIILFSRKNIDRNLDQVEGIERILAADFLKWLYVNKQDSSSESDESSEDEVKDRKKEINNNKVEYIEDLDDDINEITKKEDLGSVDEPIKIEEIKEPKKRGPPKVGYRKTRKSEIIRKNSKKLAREGKIRIDPLNVLENSIVIFDDIDVISDDETREEMRKLRDDLLETGRDRGISVIATSHQLNNYNLTKTALTEATAVVFFPKSGAPDQIRNYLKNKMGIEDKNKIDDIMHLPTRWIYIFKDSPRYILYEHGAILI